jgi:hypothetical protein
VRIFFLSLGTALLAASGAWAEQAISLPAEWYGTAQCEEGEHAATLLLETAEEGRLAGIMQLIPPDGLSRGASVFPVVARVAGDGASLEVAADSRARHRVGRGLPEQVVLQFTPATGGLSARLPEAPCASWNSL